MRKKAQESNGAPCYYSLLTGIQSCHGIAVAIPPKRENHVKTRLTSSLWGFRNEAKVSEEVKVILAGMTKPLPTGISHHFNVATLW